MTSNSKIKRTTKNDNGITLIALVITIIVLLILAGVTIVTLTGDNGLLQKASGAKTNSLEAEIEEEIRLAWNKVYADNYLNNCTAEQKASALQAELIEKDSSATVTANENELKVHYREKNKVLNISTGIMAEAISAVAKAKRDETIFNEDNTSLTDEFGNTFIVPKGFKIASDSADNVPGGIVIEDASYENTIGSQFVWIPVSRDTSDENKVKGEKNTTILLSRYTFDNEGNPTNEGANTISNYYMESASSSYGNKVAKNINDFISKTNSAGGYWIGRYEARKNSSDKLTEVGTDNIYNYITQINAAIESQGMYINASEYFDSDLINSYAWDTAIFFLQEYDNREGSNPTKYSKQTSLNVESIETTGTITDKICNIYDMASNCYEWSTETSSYKNRKGRRFPCSYRGGCYKSSTFTTDRRAHPDVAGTSNAYDYTSFRPILYIK